MVFDTHLQKGGQVEGSPPLLSSANHPRLCPPPCFLQQLFWPMELKFPGILKQQTTVLMTNSTTRNNGIASSPELGLCFFGNGKVKRLFCHFCIVISVDISPWWDQIFHVKINRETFCSHTCWCECQMTRGGEGSASHGTWPHP